MNKLKQSLLAALAILVALPSAGQEVRTYFAVDALGSPVLATDESGAEVWSESYSPLGERLTASSAAGDNSRWFTSAPQSSLTGLVDMGERQYDPVIGRFLSIDPVGVKANDPFTFNRYAYANNNPYNFLDPDGRSVYTKLFKLVRNGGDVTLTLAGVVDDYNTLTDQSASAGERIFAGVSLLSEVLPLSVRDAKEGVQFVNKVRKGEDGSDVPNSTPVGRKGQPLGGFDPKNPTNSAGKIGDREFSGHAFDRMQYQGIPPSAVENAIRPGNAVTGKVKGTTAYYDEVNNLTVITDTASGRVVTVDYGRIKQ
ncbi:MAG: RHS repeat-associated core domain-containing protein [Planctomycetota bacterium]